MIELKPIRITTEEYDEIEKKIKNLFKDFIYLPLLKDLKYPSKVLKNSKEDLIDALHSGRITYYRGRFSGRLNATISKELRSLGAKWNKLEKCYSIRQADLPQDIRGVISLSAAKFEEKMTLIDKKLAAVVPQDLANQLHISDLFDKTIFKVDKEFKKSVKNISVTPELGPDARKRIADEWQNNMQIYIKDFTEEQISKLRGEMQASVLAGNRYESAVKAIQKSYGVTENKAKFLARQETALLTSKLKEVRYQAAGVYSYRWQAVIGTPTHPTRKRHKFLSGKVFQFDHPPNTAELKGQESRPVYDGPSNFFNNPGEDFNCRCVAIPIVGKIPG